MTSVGCRFRQKEAWPTAMAFVSDPETEECFVMRSGDSALTTPTLPEGRSRRRPRRSPGERSPPSADSGYIRRRNPLLSINELAGEVRPRSERCCHRRSKRHSPLPGPEEAGVGDYFFKPLVRDLLKQSCNNILNGACDESRPIRRGENSFLSWASAAAWAPQRSPLMLHCAWPTKVNDG